MDASDRFNNKYRAQTTRLKKWNYGWNAAYFVTICSKNREHFFGEVINENAPLGKQLVSGSTQNIEFSSKETQNIAFLRLSNRMELSEIGQLVVACWNEIPTHFAFVKLGEFVVMPNHIHGIIIIDKPEQNKMYRKKMGDKLLNEKLKESIIKEDKNKFGPQSNNLASIIRGFKIGVTKGAKEIDTSFKWLPRYYDHIIRTKESYKTKANYIKNNIQNWKEDEFY